jgi:hypothetical protein
MRLKFQKRSVLKVVSRIDPESKAIGTTAIIFLRRMTLAENEHGEV